MFEIWFWQRIVSPHMAGLAVELASQGNKVVYVAERLMSDEREQQGWLPPKLGSVRLQRAPTELVIAALVKKAPADSIHICQGIRANGLVGCAQRALSARGLRQWVVMETVDDSGWRGLLKRLMYRRLFYQWRNRVEGVLAIGHRTPAWIEARGMAASRVFPFAYFLPDMPCDDRNESEGNVPFRFVYVGQLIGRKRVDLLIVALSNLKRKDVELVVIGSGVMESELRTIAEKALPEQVKWIGNIPMHQMPHALAQTDCLVLPSRHDGWGAVVSEALMTGVPAICSDACGSAGVVDASGVGGVFPAENSQLLVALLEKTVEADRLNESQRKDLASWAQCLGVRAGAQYLQTLLGHTVGRENKPVPPWIKQ